MRSIKVAIVTLCVILAAAQQPVLGDDGGLNGLGDLPSPNVVTDPSTLSTNTSTTTTAAPTSVKPTSPPTTVTPTPTSTTVTPAPSSTTVKPTPAPAPSEPTLGNYTLSDDKGEICLVALMKIVLTSNTTRTPLINGSISGSESFCSPEKIKLQISFSNTESVGITFGHDNASYFVTEITAEVDDSNVQRVNLTQFATPMNKYYKCAAVSAVDLQDDKKIVFSEMKFEAFRTAKHAHFVGSQLECTSDFHSDFIIIGIGVALTVLVVVILAAYLVARRRNRQHGYQSVA